MDKSTSSQIGDELDELSAELKAIPLSLEVSIVVTLDDFTILPFLWNPEKKCFERGFFTTGLTTT